MEKCHNCGIERPWLHNHHLKLRSEGGTSDPSNLIRICANCHEDRHGGPCGGTSRGRLSATPEARAKKGKTFKRLWADPEYREKVLAARKAGKQLDYAAIGKKNSAGWTPERKAAHAAHLSELRRTQPERWKRADESAKARMTRLWAEDPEGTKQMISQGRTPPN